MSLVFLDIDGVLNHGYDLELGFNYVVPICVANLNAITDATGAQLVISSSWREHVPFDKLCQKLKQFKVTGQIAGHTPVDLEDSEGFPVARVVEIRSYLDATKHRNFVVLDDTDIFLDVNNYHIQDAEIAPRFIQTSIDEGLTSAQASRAIALLNDSGGTTRHP